MTEELEKYARIIQAAKEAKAKAEGSLAQLLKTLKEKYGITSYKEGLALLEELNAEKNKYTEEYNTRLEKLREVIQRHGIEHNKKIL